MTIDSRQQLLATINGAITLNGTGAITGTVLNNILDTMVYSSLFNTGAWSQYTSYYPLDVVQYGSQSYYAIATNVNQIPTNTTYWAPFAVATNNASGPTNSVQYNVGGAATGSSNLLFDGTTLTANAISVTNGLTISGATSAAAITSTGTISAPTVNATTTATINNLLVTGTTTPALTLPNAVETTTVSATAATGTVNFNVVTQSILYYTTAASSNWTVNVRGSSGTTLNTLLATGQTVTIVFMATQGATGYYQTALQIDGNTVTPKWQGGSAPTFGDASSIDVYTYSITKTASATYTVLASVTKFQ